MNPKVSGNAEESPIIAAELDAAQERARVAFVAGDREAYMAMFHRALIYVRPDGCTMGYDDLAQEVRENLERAASTWCEFRRTNLVVRNDREAEETLEQHMLFAGAGRTLGMLRRDWVIIRRGDYSWLRVGQLWQVRRLDVYWEEVAGKYSQMIGAFSRGPTDVASHMCAEASS